MSKISAVTIGLIEEKPATAVRAVVKMDPSHAAAFLDTLPTRHAVSLLSRMSSWSASAMVSRMNPVSAAAVLSELDYLITASIVRILAEVDREKLLNAVPKKLSKDLASTLAYPADTVGAKMSTTIVIMTADQTAADALTELRQTKRVKTGAAYVVDGSRKLLGIVTAEELLRRSNDALLSEVIDRSIAPISARARLSTVQSLPVWDDYAHMPVVNRQKILIGALSRRTFRQPVEKSATKAAGDQAPSIFAAVASAFATSFTGLTEILTGVEIMPSETSQRHAQGVKGDRV